MTIYVKTITGNAEEETVNPSDTIKTLIDRLKTKEAYAGASNILLNYKGVDLSPTQTFESAKIQDGDNVHVMVQKGGCCCLIF